MSFTIHDGDARPARSATAVAEPKRGRDHWESSVQVRWPGDLSQRMYKRPPPVPHWSKRHARFLVAGGIALVSILGSLGKGGSSTEQATGTAVIAGPKLGSSAPALAKLPDFSDAYLDRHSVQSQATLNRRRIRNDFEDAHGG